MTNQQLKELEDNLWDSANSLRAYGGIKAADYAVPVLGLIFLKFAENKYRQHEKEIYDEYERDKGTRLERNLSDIAIAKCGFYLPEEAQYHYLLDLPGSTKMAPALRKAMELIEKYQDAKFQDVLPKEAYFDIEKKKADILPQLLKAFSDIPQDASGDMFGKIYEYFLGKFAMSEGQKGGEFFTPTSVVRFIVEVIEPYKGKVFDPACGSGGMFVQSADFIAHEGHDLNDIYVYGQEYMGETVRLAKMNLLVHNLRGEITEVNSYEDDPYDSYGKFDFVMANPPFNVKSVKESTVKNDRRFYEYGLPKNKGKKDDKITDANYLWISLFATSLNKNGRAGFVMPNSASDAKNSEYEIRKKIIDSGIVDCMVSMPSNMFLTVTLPATLWFFDKQKVDTDRKDKILFIDAKNVYNQVDRAHREWTKEQQQNLAAIVRLYRGETKHYLELISTYIKEYTTAQKEVEPARKELEMLVTPTLANLKSYAETTKEEKRTAVKKKVLEESEFFGRLENYRRNKPVSKDSVGKEDLDGTPLSTDNEEQLKISEKIRVKVSENRAALEALEKETHSLLDLYWLADKNLKLKNDKTWSKYSLGRMDKAIEEALGLYSKAVQQAAYLFEQIEWLQERFPEAEYKDVEGLCKASKRNEYGEEQDYSLNSGRYVGIVTEDDTTTKEEFTTKIRAKLQELIDLNQNSHFLENSIETNVLGLLDE